MKAIIRFLCLLTALLLCCLSVSAEGYDDELYIEDDINDYTRIDSEESLHETDGSTLITITCTGDCTIGRNVKTKKDIFGDELKAHEGNINFTMQNMRDIFLKDDMTLVNFEGTLSESPTIPPEKKGNDFLFLAPPEWVSMLSDNGIDAVSLENNHVMDFGSEGYEDTKDALRGAGIIYSNSTELGVIQVKDVQIAMLSYLCIDRYDKPVGGYNSLWEKVAADIKAAKEFYPIVIVSFHWGNEKDYTPRENQIKMGHLAVDSGADLVIGHHSHRMNPIEEYNGVYICYSLGNFCFSGNSKPSDMSSFVFQTKFRVKDGEAKNEGFIIIPIRISSRTDRNDFIPTPLEKEKNIVDVLNTLKENGKKLQYAVTDYPLSWN